MDLNPLAQLDRVKGSCCVSEAQQAPFVSFWEIVEVAHRSSVVNSATSRRFLRELDKAPRGNNLQYIYYSVLVSLLLVTRV